MMNRDTEFLGDQFDRLGMAKSVPSAPALRGTRGSGAAARHHPALL